MNEHEFDRIVWLWATRSHRRRVLRLIGAGIMAGFWGHRGGTNAAAQASLAQMTCLQDADCRDGDADPCTGATCVDGLCTFFIVDCIPSYVCCGNGECCPAGETGRCRTYADCASSSMLSCWEAACVNGTCMSRHMDCSAGEFCRFGACIPIGAGPLSVPS